MEKNTIVPLYFELWNSTTNSRDTGADDSAHMTMQASKDGAQCTAGAGAFAEVLSSTGGHIGLYKYTPTQTETNGNALYFLAATSTANMVMCPAGFYTQVMATPPAMITAQAVRDSMKLDASAGAPAAGSVDKHLDDIPTSAAPAMITAQQVRDSMKLDASAGAPAAGSIDKQLDDVPADTADSVLDEALGAHAGFLTTVNTIAPATPGNVSTVDGHVTAVGNLVSALNDVSPADLVAAAHDEAIEGALTSRQIHRLLGAVAAGKTTITPTGPGTADVVLKSMGAGTKNRVTANMTGSERTAVTLDVS